MSAQERVLTGAGQFLTAWSGLLAGIPGSWNDSSASWSLRQSEKVLPTSQNILYRQCCLFGEPLGYRVRSWQKFLICDFRVTLEALWAFEHTNGHHFKGVFFILCRSTMRDQKMKYVKKMGSILIADFYLQMCIYLCLYKGFIFSVCIFLSEVRHCLLEMILTLKTFLWGKKRPHFDCQHLDL